MIDDPVEYASATFAQPNSVVAQIHHSSPIRERWIPIIERMKSASATKSRSETPSIEFAEFEVKPKSRAVTSGERGSEEPARAPEPSGLTDVLFSQSEIRSRSLSKD